VQVGQSLAGARSTRCPGKTYEGKVIAVNPLIDAAGPLDRDPRAGGQPGHHAAARACSPASSSSRAPSATPMMLPEEALVPQGSEQYVFRVNDGKVTRVKVETGQRRDGKVEIVNGLSQGRRHRHRRPAQAARRRLGPRRRRRQGRARGAGAAGDRARSQERVKTGGQAQGPIAPASARR
jgi:hypothetical protein